MIKNTIIGGLGLGFVIPAALDGHSIAAASASASASASSSSSLFPSPTSSPSCSYADLGPWAALINEDEKLAIEQLGRLKRARLINDGIISNNHEDYCYDYNMDSCTSSRGSFPNTPISRTNPRLIPSSWRTLSASSVDIESMEGIKSDNLLIKEINSRNHDEEVSKNDCMGGDNQVDSESDFEKRSVTPRYKLLADLYTSCPLIQPLITEIKRPIRKGDQRKRKAG